MPAPKDQGKTPVARTIKFVKKANQWVYGKHFNENNVVDKMLWFATEDEAKKAYLEDTQTSI